MAEQTFYPDANPESTTVDGLTAYNSGGALTFAQIIAAAGTYQIDTGATGGIVDLGATLPTGSYSYLNRSLYLFDISGLPAGTITSAVFSLYVVSTTDNGDTGATSDGSKMVLCSSAPASNTALANADFQTLGSTDYGRSVKQSSLTTSAYNDITLTAAGITFLQTAQSGAGIVKFGIKYGWDFDADSTGLTWINNGDIYIIGNYADAGTNKPKLVITYTPAEGGIARLLNLLGVGN